MQMKIWRGFGSEHSMNLVMIGKFKSVADAEKAKRIIDLITKQVLADMDSGAITIGSRTERYTDGMMALLRELNVYDLNTVEVEQFAYDISVEQKQDTVSITTDESDVSAYLKILVAEGARVEVFSAHFYSKEQDEPDKKHSGIAG
jgi:Family of unknown function (DUF6375)